eukprot:s3888_g8.t1
MALTVFMVEAFITLEVFMAFMAFMLFISWIASRWIHLFCHPWLILGLAAGFLGLCGTTFPWALPVGVGMTFTAGGGGGSLEVGALAGHGLRVGASPGYPVLGVAAMALATGTAESALAVFGMELHGVAGLPTALGGVAVVS